MRSNMARGCSGSNSKTIALTNGSGNNSHPLSSWMKVDELLPVLRGKLLPPISYSSPWQTRFHGSSGMKSEQLMRDKPHIKILFFSLAKLMRAQIKGFQIILPDTLGADCSSPTASGSFKAELWICFAVGCVHTTVSKSLLSNHKFRKSWRQLLGIKPWGQQ